MSVTDLVAGWRARAEQLRPYASAAAVAYETAAAELEKSIEQSGIETLNLVEAASASGYTADHLGKLVREGKIKNVGRANAPRIRLADLPVKPGTVAGPKLVGNNLDAIKHAARKSRIG